MKRFCLIIFFGIFSVPLPAAEELPVLWLEAGKENEVGFPVGLHDRRNLISGPAQSDSSDQWTLRVEHRVLTSGRSKHSLTSSGKVYIATVTPPPQNPGVCLRGTLSFGAITSHQVIIAAPNPFSDEKTWYRKYPIALYDPEEKTKEYFKKEDFEHESITAFAEIASLANKTLVIGENVSFEKNKELAELLFEKVAQGVPVLVLAPKGKVPLSYEQPIDTFRFSKDPKYFFPDYTEYPHNAQIWQLEGDGDQIVLASRLNKTHSKNPANYPLNGPQLLDIRFLRYTRSNESHLKSRIIFIKKLLFTTSWPVPVQNKYYFKALVEELNK